MQAQRFLPHPWGGPGAIFPLGTQAPRDVLNLPLCFAGGEASLWDIPITSSTQGPILEQLQLQHKVSGGAKVAGGAVGGPALPALSQPGVLFLFLPPATGAEGCRAESEAG